MEKEKGERRGCKITICDTARNHKADGGDIACSAVKTWPAGDLRDNILKGKLDWPWGNAQCKVDVKIERKMLAQALSSPIWRRSLPKQTVTCTLDQKGGSGNTISRFAITPTVTFAGGKATKATLNWSDIQGSALAKGAVMVGRHARLITSECLRARPWSRLTRSSARAATRSRTSSANNSARP